MTGELQAASAEMQSYYEKLNNLNSRLQQKISELERIENDLTNLLAGSETATLFLDHEMRITWFTPTMTELFALAATDIGRPIGHFARKFSDTALLADAATVLNTLTTIEAEVISDTGQWFLRRMLPYRTRDGQVGGVVVTFTNITERHTASQKAEDARDYAEAIVASVNTPLVVVDAGLRIRTANAAFHRLFSLTRTDRDVDLIETISCGDDGLSALRQPLEEVISRDQPITDLEIQLDLSGLGLRNLLLNARKLNLRAPGERLVLLSVDDITKRKLDDYVAKRLAAIVESSDDAIFSKTPEGVITSWNEGAERLLGYSAEDIIGRSVMTIVPPDRQREEREILARIGKGEPVRIAETIRYRSDGEPIWISLTLSPLRDDIGRIIGVSSIARDVTGLRRSRELRRTLLHELNHRMKNQMAVIQSIASQTMSHAETLAGARASFSARLANLSRAHDLLTRESWQYASLGDVVADTVEPHDPSGSRITFHGPEVRVGSAAAQIMAMALHELCTNALKHGALSSSGNVSINWEISGEGDDRQFLMDWSESGGPPVEKPMRRGFGSNLLERALAMQLGGKVLLEYAPGGFTCRIIAPIPAGQDLLGEPKEIADAEQAG